MSKRDLPKKKVLWLTSNSMNVEPVRDSLDSVESFDFEIEKVLFDTVSELIFDEIILLEVSKFKPDLVLYIGHAEGPHVPRTETFKAIREHCPIVNFVFDGGCPNWWPALKRFRENKCFDTTVNIDGNHDWPKGENDLTLLCPIDPRPYAKVVKKDIPFGFYGGASSKDREEMVDALLREGLLTIAERNEAFGSYHQYADFMLRCQLVLNMAKTGSGKSMHVKARVTESGLAKACLLEPKKSPASHWFRPGVDYVEYASLTDLIIQARTLLANPELIKKYADSLHARVKTDYTPERFFTKIFEKLGWAEWKN